MNLTGKQLIGHRESAKSDETFRASNPRSGTELEPVFYESTSEEISEAVELAASVFGVFRNRLARERADFLEAICQETMALGDDLLERASAETGHPLARCEMERNRIIQQAQLFSELIREGSWADARIDLGDSDRQPMPKPDVRSMMQPIGPIAVFGASNFPIAISVLGADTISAFAAGCPVIVKAHPAHPGTCELAARAILSAAKRCNMPEGIFSMIHGRNTEVGRCLVEHPGIMAAAFTGSLAGGRALMDVAAARPVPIPFYAEMGSVNPIFVLPSALAQRKEQIAAGFVTSLTMGVGQFCTNPGLVAGMESDDWEKFSELVAEKVSEFAPSTMLHAGIHEAYTEGIEIRNKSADLELIGKSSARPNPDACEAAAYVFQTNRQGITSDPTLLDELFGPVSTLVNCGGLEDMVAIAEKMDGSLSASVHGTEEDLVEFHPLLSVLQRKAGRLIFNGYPVGIEVCHSIHHGGPYPAASHSFFTSIGTRCIERFVRPVCYQDWPDSQLPTELQNANPLNVWRMVDGTRSNKALKA
jgi:NADP-dependent aldehyde dehydrogenase